MLLRGIGAAILTPISVAEELAGGQIAYITISDLPASFRDSALVCLARGSTLSAATLDFIQVMQEEADKMQPFLYRPL